MRIYRFSIKWSLWIHYLSNDMPEFTDAFTARLKQSLQFARANTSKLRKLHTGFLIASIVSSSATTLVAAITAAQGPIIGEGPEGWKISCIIAAFFGFTATICVGLNQQLKVSDRLSKSNQCLGRLQSLDVATDIGSRNTNEIMKEFEELVKVYPEIMGSYYSE